MNNIRAEDFESNSSDDGVNQTDDEELRRIRRIFNCFWINMSALSSEIRRIKQKNNLDSREAIFAAFNNICELEHESKFIFNSTLSKLKSFDTITMHDQKNVLLPKIKTKRNSLSLRKQNTPVYTDDDISCVNAILQNNNYKQKSLLINGEKKEEDTNILYNDEDDSTLLNVQVDNYNLIFEKSKESHQHDFRILNENDELIGDVSKFVGNSVLDAIKLKPNEKVKINFYNVHCTVKKNEENSDDSGLPLNEKKCDNNINCFDNKENIVVMKEEEFDGSTTHCTELSIANFEEFDTHTEKLDDLDESNCVTYTVPEEEDNDYLEQHKKILEDLCSEDTLDYDDTDEEQFQNDDNNTEDGDKELEDRLIEIDPTTTKRKSTEGRVIDTDLVEMQRKVQASEKFDWYVKIIRDKDLEKTLVKHINRHEDTDEEDIKRLTNLNSLKRRSTYFSSNDSIDRKRVKRIIPIVNTDTTDVTTDDESETNNENEDCDELVIVPPKDTIPNEYNDDMSKLEILLDHLSDKETSDKETDSDDEKKKGEKATSTTSENKKKRMNKKRSKWRQDRLLNEKLTISSSSSSESDSDDSTSTGILNTKAKNEVEDKIKNKSVREGKSITKIDLIPSTIASDSKLQNKNEDSSSDVIINVTTTDEEENSSNTDLLEEYVVNIDSDSDKDNNVRGRRNIRALISDDVLADETKRANKEEERRKQRLIDKEKHLDKFHTQSQTQTTESLILDIDEDLKPLITVDSALAKRLKPHQREGVKFMWNSCYESVDRIKNGEEGSGCLLAHCMGLGKTFQVVTLVHTLFSHPVTNTKRVLVISPLSTVLNWRNEFKIGLDCARNCNINVYIICDKTKLKNQRLFLVDNWWKETGVLIMGYQTYISLVRSIKNVNVNKLTEALIDPGPDLVVCDEGHLLKNNKTLSFQKISNIRTKRRIILTGTPIQNNLKEYYHMIQFVKPNLLGSYREFTNRFINPITNGQFHDSTTRDTSLMKKRSHVLHKILLNTLQRYEVSELKTYLPPKKDYAVFIRLTDIQAKLYEKYVNVIMENEVTKKESILQHYHNLQLIWNHPILLDFKLKTDVKTKPREFDVFNIEPDIPAEGLEGVPKDWWKESCPPDVIENIQLGSKFLVTLSIMELSEKLGDKVLIFSSSLVELDALELFLLKIGTFNRPWTKGVDYYRIDGTILPDVRMSFCNKFNDSTSPAKALLITHRVGGLGLNLVAANRVILLDVCWNPSYDNQSIFRVYRFGQKKPCFIYRLISKGTLEETIYLRSINKLATAGRVVDERQLARHFRMKDLQFLYEFHDDLTIKRPIPKIPHEHLLATLLNKHEKEIFNYHEHQSLLENIPEEELDEEEMKLAWEEFNKEKDAAVPTVPEQQPNFQNEVNVNLDAALEWAKMHKRDLINSWRRTIEENLDDITQNQTDPLQNTVNVNPPVVTDNVNRQLGDVIVID